MIYEAREAYNKIIPEAKGEAERNIKNAEGYAMERINRSKGDANRFLMQWKEYSKAKDVTRRRLYLETMGEVIPKLGTKYILDPEQSGLLPLLNLGENGGKNDKQNTEHRRNSHHLFSGHRKTPVHGR